MLQFFVRRFIMRHQLNRKALEVAIESILPASEEEWLKLRVKDVTSTESSALFGVCPYTTEFELWHQKKNAQVVAYEENAFTLWGKRLQDAIAYGVAQDNGWTIRKMGEYIRDPELRMGASFDFSIEDVSDGELNHVKKNGTAVFDKISVGVGLLEIKNVFGMIFKDQWLEDEDGNLEAPPHIEIQVQHQLAVTGRSFAYIAALVSGNKIELIKRTPDALIIKAIRDRIVDFWYKIANNTPPKPDYAKDSEFIASLFGYAEPGKIFDARGNEDFSLLIEKYRELGESEKACKETRATIKARLLQEIQDCEKVIGDGYTISAGTVGPAEIEAYTRKPYRMFKANFPRNKKEE